MLETNGSNLSESVSLATFESGGDRVDDSAVAEAPCTDNGTPPDDDDDTGGKVVVVVVVVIWKDGFCRTKGRCGWTGGTVKGEVG